MSGRLVGAEHGPWLGLALAGGRERTRLVWVEAECGARKTGSRRSRPRSVKSYVVSSSCYVWVGRKETGWACGPTEPAHERRRRAPLIKAHFRASSLAGCGRARARPHCTPLPPLPLSHATAKSARLPTGQSPFTGAFRTFPSTGHCILFFFVL